jgi:hypothetical protein
MAQKSSKKAGSYRNRSLATSLLALLLFGCGGSTQPPLTDVNDVLPITDANDVLPARYKAQESLLRPFVLTFASLNAQLRTLELSPIDTPELSKACEVVASSSPRPLTEDEMYRVAEEIASWFPRTVSQFPGVSPAVMFRALTSSNEAIRWAAEVADYLNKLNRRRLARTATFLRQLLGLESLAIEKFEQIDSEWKREIELLRYVYETFPELGISAEDALTLCKIATGRKTDLKQEDYALLAKVFQLTSAKKKEENQKRGHSESVANLFLNATRDSVLSYLLMN